MDAVGEAEGDAAVVPGAGVVAATVGDGDSDGLVGVPDGVGDAAVGAGADFYDPLPGLTGARPDSPGLLLDTLCRDVHRHCGGPARDDIAMLAVRRAR